GNSTVTQKQRKPLKGLARPAGIEPATPAFGVLWAHHSSLKINALCNSQIAKPRLAKVKRSRFQLAQTVFSLYFAQCAG
ncbi:hypothetical protein SNK19_19735, partial [Ralstonia pseudosolanacearum]